MKDQVVCPELLVQGVLVTYRTSCLGKAAGSRILNTVVFTASLEILVRFADFEAPGIETTILALQVCVGLRIAWGVSEGSLGA